MWRETQDRMLKTAEQRHTIDFFKDTLKTLIHQSDKEPVGRCLATMGHTHAHTCTGAHTHARKQKAQTKNKTHTHTQMPAKSTLSFH